MRNTNLVALLLAGGGLLAGCVGVTHAQDVSPPPLLPPEQSADAEDPQPAAARSYWIGILGGEVSPELRSHLGLEGAGVLVREVVPGSPAEEAGLKQHDVLLTANGKAVTDMRVLAQEVRKVGGTEEGEIEIGLLRTGGHQQLTIVPAQRPAEDRLRRAPNADPAAPALPPGLFGGGGFDQAENGPFRFRLFGPGIAVGGGDINVQAGNVSVKVESRNGKSRVAVTQGDQSWEFDADDSEALEQLPPDTRATVEGLLNSQRQGVDIEIDAQDMLPQLEGWFQGFGERRAERIENRMRRQMERMEQQLEAMRRQLEGDNGAAQPAAPPAGANVAPPFEPEAPPAEIELPAVEAETEE